MTDLLSMLEEMDRHAEPECRDTIVRAPFAYPGSKSKSVKEILPHLPYTNCYVEPFGGSAAVLLARHPSRLEVYNDRYGGVVSFYRCMRDLAKCEQLIDNLECTVHSREDFIWAKATWEHDSLDDVERATRWYYMTMYSFGRLGRNFGRSTCGKTRLAALRDKAKLFPAVHERFKHAQVENQEAMQCIRDYDGQDTVFYLDPPYVDANMGIYKHEYTINQHRELIDLIFSLKGFVAVSGYGNPLYDNQPWDDRHEWEQFVSMKSMAYTKSNQKAQLKGVEERGKAKEVLWIKEAS